MGPPTKRPRESRLFPCATPMQVAGPLFLSDSAGPEAGPRASDAAHRATRSVGARTTELSGSQRHNRGQPVDRDRLCFQQLGSSHGEQPRAAAPGSHIRGCPVCFPGRRSHPAKPVCLLRDFRRILRPLSKATSLRGLGSQVLCHGPAKAFMGRLLREPRQMVTLRGEKKITPKVTALQVEEGAPRSTRHPELREVLSAGSVHL